MFYSYWYFFVCLFVSIASHIIRKFSLMFLLGDKYQLRGEKGIKSVL